jgi:hypothetical protein
VIYLPFVPHHILVLFCFFIKQDRMKQKLREVKPIYWAMYAVFCIAGALIAA